MERLCKGKSQWEKELAATSCDTDEQGNLTSDMDSIARSLRALLTCPHVITVRESIVQVPLGWRLGCISLLDLVQEYAILVPTSLDLHDLKQLAQPADHILIRPPSLLVAEIAHSVIAYQCFHSDCEQRNV